MPGWESFLTLRQRERRINRGAVLALVLALAFGGLFTACGRNQAESPAAPETAGTAAGTGNSYNENSGGTRTAVLNKDAVYKTAELDFGRTYTSVIDYAYGGGRLYVYGLNAHLKENGEISREYTVCGVDPDGGEAETLYTYAEIVPAMGAVSRSGDSRGSVLGLSADKNGNLYALTCGLSDTAEGYTETYFLIRWDSEGREKWSVTVENGTQSLSPPVCVEDRLYLVRDNTVLIYTDAGEFETGCTVENVAEKLKNGELTDRIDGLYAAEDGTLYLKYSSLYMTGATVVSFDPDTGELGEPLPAGSLDGFTLTAGTGSGYDFILRDSLSVYGWNFGEEEKTLLFNFVDSGLDSGDVGKLDAAGEGSFVSACRTDEDTPVLCRLTKVAPEDVRERIPLTAGMLVTDNSRIIRDAARFNRSSEEYQIQLVDYSEYTDPLTQLSLDVVNGQAPDVFLVNWYSYVDVPMEAYARQGVFENLFTWLDRDGEFRREDFLTNVLEAGQINGQLFYLSAGFSVSTSLAKTSVVGDRDGWSMEEMRQVESEYPDSKLMSVRCYDLLRREVAVRWQEFADEENGIGYFDSDAFIELLEWTKEYPAETAAPKSSTPYRSGEYLVANLELRTFSDMNRDIDRMFGEEAVTFIGLPGAKGSGALINNKGITLAMSAKSRNKEGAWQFLRYYLSDGYQGDTTGRMNGMFPIRRSALEKLAEESINSPIRETYQLNGREVSVEPPTREEIDGWIAYIESVDCADVLDNELYQIIEEEAGAFYAGQKSAADVAKIIQGRIGMYLAEKQ